MAESPTESITNERIQEEHRFKGFHIISMHQQGKSGTPYIKLFSWPHDDNNEQNEPDFVKALDVVVSRVIAISFQANDNFDDSLPLTILLRGNPGVSILEFSAKFRSVRHLHGWLSPQAPKPWLLATKVEHWDTTEALARYQEILFCGLGNFLGSLDVLQRLKYYASGETGEGDAELTKAMWRWLVNLANREAKGSIPPTEEIIAKDGESQKVE